MSMTRPRTLTDVPRACLQQFLFARKSRGEGQIPRASSPSHTNLVYFVVLGGTKGGSWEVRSTGNDEMPRVPRRALVWSKDQRRYALYRQGEVEPRFHLVDDAVLLTWLGEATSFAFHGASGSLNVYQESRPRGGRYWYAYHTEQGRTRKRYLGGTQSLSLARLEETARDLWHEQKPPPLIDEWMTLLATKLAPPRLPSPLVGRPRLLAALDGALVTPFTLLSASAGWGKTTLLSSWARQQCVPIAWLSLEDRDNSSTPFWVALIAALRRCGRYAPTLGAAVLALLQSPQPPPLPTYLAALLNELELRAVHPASVVVILDDYQVITDPAIHQGLSFWLEHLPAHLHVILSSRVDPLVPLARLRARGQLTEIRTGDLRFHREEASSFLRVMLAPPLAAEEERVLQDRTEGWIAGLQLAALALRKCRDRATFLRTFTGSQRYLVDYIQEEILAYLPPSMRDFLLHTAVLSRMDAAVCQAVIAATTTAACQQMLLYLEANNLFLAPLDEEQRCYRLHDVFREALLATLHTTQPEAAPELHRRAARFYEGQEEWSEAIAHRLAAADFSAATRLMEKAIEQFWLRGEAATMAHWVLTLPTRQVREHARLVLTTALYLLFTVAQATAEERAKAYNVVHQLMTRVETALLSQMDETSRHFSAPHADLPAELPAEAASPSHRFENREDRAAEHALLQWRLHLLRMFLAVLEATATGDHERVNSMRQEIQEALDRDEEAIWQMVPLSCSFVLHYTVWQEGARLLPQLLDTRERVSRSGSLFATIKVKQWLALTAPEAGRLHLAYEESQTALGLIEHLAGYAPLKAYFEIAQAVALYQWNRLEEARRNLHAALHAATAWQQLDILGSGYVYLMQVELARGDWTAARQARDAVEHLVQRERVGVYPNWLPAMKAQWWLAQGQLTAASDWAAEVIFPDDEWDGRLYAAFPVVVRVYFAQRRWKEALGLLERWSGRLDRPANIAMTMTFLTQYMVALHQTGQREQARAVAARLFALTKPEGYLRVYLDEGESMRQTLQALLTPRSQHAQHAQMTSSTSATYVAQLVAAFEHEQHGASEPQEAAPHRSLSPTLTRREREVLRLLATGASNQEIAQSLVISMATVKKHVSNLLSKLGAASRTQAIVQARARSLL